MQDNELDKLINEAASQHHPPYDDEAWGKMLVLLDKHLPQKKDRRRPVIYLLLFLLLGSGILLGVLQPWKNKTATADNTVSGNKPGNGASSSITPVENTPGNNTAVPGAAASSPAAPNAAPVNNNAVTSEKTTAPATSYNSSMPQAAIIQSSGNEELVKANRVSLNGKGKSVIKTKRPAAVSGDEEAGSAVTIPGQKEPGAIKDSQISGEEGTIVTKEAPQQDQNKKAALTTTAETQKAKEPEEKNSTTQKGPVTAVNRKEKKDRSFAGNFALTFSGGADMSFVELSNPGKTKLFYGAGAAYSFGKHIRVGAGFYVSKKVYSATAYQYKFPNGATYPNLKEVDADCNVYEIPLNVYYGFGRQKNHSWFAGAGISSLLMKKEHYNYLYKTPAGQSYSYAKTVTNENNHYFSVVTVSGGYQYNLNNRFSFIAEPYIKVPLAGVGAGKIKLNSTGILVTAAIKPFARSKK